MKPLAFAFTTQFVVILFITIYITHSSVNVKNGKTNGRPKYKEAFSTSQGIPTIERPTPHSFLRWITNIAPSIIIKKCQKNECVITCQSKNKRLQTILLLLILMSGDIEMNPGPRTYDSIYPCGICEGRVNWSNKAIACDECDIWYHQSCISMSSSNFNQHVHNQSAVWICYHCSTANYCSSFTFHSFEQDQSTNKYSLLEQDKDCSSNLSMSLKSPETFFNPKFTSSPTDKIDRSTHQSKRKKSIGSVDENHPLPIPDKPQNNLRILNLNAQSIRKKISELKVVLDYCNPDVVCITETWLFGKKPGKDPEKHCFKDSELDLEDYKQFRNDRNEFGGGLTIMVRKEIISNEEPEFVTECEINWIKIKLKKNHRDLLIGCFYMAHRNSRELNELNRSLELLSKKNHHNIILCGDFNCPNINWDTHTIEENPDDHKQQLIDIVSQHGLHQMVRETTRYRNTLDLIFTSNPSLSKSVTTIPGLSDHDIVVGDFNSKPQYLLRKKRTVLLYKKANWKPLKELCKIISEDIIDVPTEQRNIEHMWENFKLDLKEAIKHHIPSKTVTNRNSVPWMTSELKRLIRQKARLHKKAKETNDWTEYKQVQKTCKKIFRKAEHDYINRKIQEGLKSKNSKPMWRYIKSRKQDNIGVAHLLDKGKLKTSNSEIADTLLKQFRSVFTTSATKKTAQAKKHQVSNTLDSIAVSTKGVEKLLRNIQPEKASGPDELPNRVLKECATELAPGVTEIFQHSLNTGTLPADWRKANISPVFKKGDRHRAENYRPVSLTSVLCKLLEHIVYRSMMEHLEKNKILTNLNHGFRSGFSTETQLTVTMNDLARNHDENVQSDIAVLDFSKAFDTVPHDRLLLKLKAYGVDGQLLKWITNFLCQRTMRVLVNGEASQYTEVLSGVPQGTVLGPLLFLCHINDLPETVTSSVRLFADDCLVYRQIRSIQDHLLMQRDLDNLEDWAATWGMRFNASKCVILRVAPKEKSEFFYQLDETILKEVSDSPYLGINISKDLLWKNHINNINGKANSTLGFLKRNLSKCPCEIKRMAYVSMVRSILEYGAVVWDPIIQNEIDKLEKTQRKAARFISGDYTSRHPGCVTKMLHDQNLIPLRERRKNIRLTFLYKIVEGHLPPIPANEYLEPIVNKRKIKSRTFNDYESVNAIEKYETSNNRCFRVPPVSKPKGVYSQSFFVRTISDWNKLSDDIVAAGSIDTFRALISKN